MFVRSAPSLSEITERLGPTELVEAIEAPSDVIERDRYLHWDKLRHLDPPQGLSSRQWWLRVKLARSDEFRQLDLRAVDGEPFVYTVPDLVQRALHRVDQQAAGTIEMERVVTSNRDAGKRYLVNSLEEEAIRSSQLEGAMTSRVAAKELLRTGRDPRNRSERMIANNYRAMQFMRNEIGDSLKPETIIEVQRIVVDGTRDDPADAGRIQQPGEERVGVFDRDDRERPVHVPPAAEELPERMAALCRFANEEGDDGPFVHPVLRAILVHFALAYDHPFVDGNGRTARVLFFWMMRKQGYWLTEYLPISRLLRKAPAQYNRAFLETETDGGDTTYFLIHQLQVIEQAVADLQKYLRRKAAEQREGERNLDDADDLNGRQVVLLTHALKHPEHAYTFGGHARSNRVTHETARADLGELAKRGLLVRRRRERGFLFEPAPDLSERLKESGG
jgi:Fic family protein